jgi:hypothetical protein
VKRVLSYGGGLDSFAMLIGAAQRRDLPDVVAFVDVADPAHEDPGEWDSTYRHIEEVVRPLCHQLGVEFVVIDGASYPVRDARSLFAWLKARRQIPMSGPNRICTIVAKVERFEKWMDDRFPGEDVEVWVGFEAGEEGRADKDPNAGKKRKLRPGAARRVNRFPLIEWGMCRCACEELVQRAGFPIPRKSACVFCPYGTKGDWQRLAVERPIVFGKVVELEADKPPTAKRGLKLTIMAYDSKKKRGVPLDQWVKTPYRAQRDLKPCTVCGRAVRATKATGCDYLPPPAPPAQSALSFTSEES